MLLRNTPNFTLSGYLKIIGKNTEFFELLQNYSITNLLKAWLSFVLLDKVL